MPCFDPRDTEMKHRTLSSSQDQPLQLQHGTLCAFIFNLPNPKPNQPKNNPQLFWKFILVTYYAHHFLWVDEVQIFPPKGNTGFLLKNPFASLKF